MEKIKVGDEIIYIKKDYFGWKVVHPIKIDGKINYPNLLYGGKANLIKTTIIVLLILFLLFGFWDMNKQCKAISKNPCAYCDYLDYTYSNYGGENGQNILRIYNNETT